MADKGPPRNDESNRIARRETVKGRVRREANSEVVGQGDSFDEGERAL